MTNQQKLDYLLNELRLAAKQDAIYQDAYKDTLVLQEVFESGEVYGFSSFARALLESINETYE